jgi:sugar phosphate isomerase/epimerase
MIASPEVTTMPMAWVDVSPANLQLLSAIGYRGVEIQTRNPALFDRTAFRKQIQTAGLEVTGVSTAPAVTEDGLFLTSPDESIRAETVRRLVRVVEFAAECGTHATIGRIRGTAGWAPSRETGLDWLRSGLTDVLERAEALGVSVVIEPQSRQLTDMFNTVGSTLAFVESFGSEALMIEVDTYHISQEERSAAAALVTAHKSGRLVHVQMSDSNHLAPGWGLLNWAEIFGTLDALEYAGSVSVEALQEPTGEAVARQAFQLIEVYTAQEPSF